MRSRVSFLVRVDLKLLEKPIAFVRIEAHHFFPDFQERDSPFSDPIIDCPHRAVVTRGNYGFGDELTLR
jgi:hypothetical protein